MCYRAWPFEDVIVASSMLMFVNMRVLIRIFVMIAVVIMIINMTALDLSLI